MYQTRHNRLIATFLAFVIVTSMIAGCGSTTPGSTTPNPAPEPISSSNNPPSTNTDIPGDTDKSDVENMNLFAYDFYDKLSSGENFMYSPYSVSMALSMLLNGADGNSRTELEQILHVSDLDRRNQTCSSFIDKKYNGNTELYISNSIWLSEYIKPDQTAEKEFFKPVKDIYRTENYEVDFAAESTLEKINKWASDNTNGMIDPFLGSIDPDTKMCLMNAIYFKGEWENKFAEDRTFDAPFYAINGEQMAETMHQYGVLYKYVASDGLRGLELPYDDGATAMDIFIPENPDAKNVYEIMQAMTAEEKLELITSFDNAAERNIDTLALPKFEFETPLMDLVNPLKQSGANEIFDGELADFTKIGADFYVAQIMQKAKIIVDEKGTKAAAVTGVMMNTESVSIEPEITFDFIVDHPFFYCIRDTESGEILFMGYMCSFNK